MHIRTALRLALNLRCDCVQIPEHNTLFACTERRVKASRNECMATKLRHSISGSGGSMRGVTPAGSARRKRRP